MSRINQYGGILRAKVQINKSTQDFNRTWLRQISQILGSQLLLQGIGFAISILLVRFLTKNDYALYTVIISIQSILNILSNSGIITGVKSIAAREWANNRNLSKLIYTASEIRKFLVLLALLIAFVYGILILDNQDISAWYVFGLLAFLLLLIIPEINRSIITTVLVMKKQIVIPQVSEIINQTTRLCLLLAFIVLMPNILDLRTVLLVTLVAAWLSYGYILKRTTYLRNLDRSISSDYKFNIIRFIKLNWHNSAFFAFKGQISILLIGIFGTTENLANLGALTRFSLIFLVANAVFNNVIAPEFGRMSQKLILRKKIRITVYLMLIISILLLIIVIGLSDHILWILGPSYSELSHELILVFISGIVGLFASIIIGFNQTKGWIKYTPVWEIPLNIISIIIGVVIFDISTLQGVLHLSILSVSTNLFLYILNLKAGLKEMYI